MPCRRCRSVLEQRATFCPHCGAVQDAPSSHSLECENHSGQPVVGLCIVCGKPVCGDCASTIAGRFVCEESAHKTVAEQWSVVHVCTFPFEGDMVVQNLLNAGYTAKLFSFRDHIGLRWVQDADRVQVFVPHHQRTAALELLKQLPLPESTE
jgi:hypothetical protein